MHPMHSLVEGKCLCPIQNHFLNISTFTPEMESHVFVLERQYQIRRHSCPGSCSCTETSKLPLSDNGKEPDFHPVCQKLSKDSSGASARGLEAKTAWYAWNL
jgi:hypothetical protein